MSTDAATLTAPASTPAPAPATDATPAVTAPASEAPSKPDAHVKIHPKVAAKEPVPTAASLLAPQRYIPGAPPPEPPKVKPPKQKKKKPKKEGDTGSVADAHSAALIETAPDQADIDAGKVADELVANEEEIERMLKEDEVIEEERKGLSPALTALEKKTKNLQDRVVRGNKYLEIPDKDLNEGQRALKSALPALEATLKEIGEAKTAIEMNEAKHDAAHQEEKKRRKQEELANRRRALRDMFAAADRKAITKIHVILSFLSLSSALTHPSSSRPFVAPIDDADRAAIARGASILLGDDLSNKEQIIQGLLNERSSAELEGIPYKRLRSLAESYARPPSPEPSESGLPSTAQVNGTEVHPPPAGVAFITESQLDTTDSVQRPLQFGAVDTSLDQVSGLGTNDVSSADQSLSQSIEIVEGSSIPSAAAVQKEWVEVGKHELETDGDSATVTAHPDEPTSAVTEGGAINWADEDDDGGLPSIDSLHDKFGTSGNATPIETTPATASAQSFPPNQWVAPAQAEDAGVGTPPEHSGPMVRQAPPNEEEGWTPTQQRGSGYRGRGGSSGFRRPYDSGFRGDRGGRGGRGGYRGDFRGGPGGPGFGSGWKQAGPGPSDGQAGSGGEEGWAKTDGPRGRGRGRGDWRGRGGDGERRGRGSSFRGQSQPPQAPPQ